MTKMASDSKELLERLKLLSTTISNVDLQASKWHSEVMNLIDDIAYTISSQQYSIARILQTLLEQEKIIVRLLEKDAKKADFLALPQSEQDKKPN